VRVVATPAQNRNRGGIAFLLSQLGQCASDQFAERLTGLGLVPAQAGILRAVAAEPGRSQQALSEQLGLLPSRVVSFIDDLEGRGYLERRRNATDRRLHALHLSAAGEELMGRLSEVAAQHERAVAAGLSSADRTTLQKLLATVAAQQGLTPGVHPGFRTMGRAAREGQD
jgi:DNA-binding MarR family transcriptional regulator